VCIVTRRFVVIICHYNLFCFIDRSSSRPQCTAAAPTVGRRNGRHCLELLGNVYLEMLYGKCSVNVQRLQIVTFNILQYM